MVKAIMGLKGSGKTKALADMANAAVAADNGNIIYIEKGKTLIYDISYKARLVDIEDYRISDYDTLYGFIAGLIAGDHDISEIFIDSISKICSYSIPDIEKFLARVDEVSAIDNIKVTVTVSGDMADATEKIKKYLI